MDSGSPKGHKPGEKKERYGMEIEREYVGGELGAFLQLEVYHGDPWRALVPHGMKNTARCAQKCCRWTLEKKAGGS